MTPLIPLLMGILSFSHSILNEQLWTVLAKWIRMGLEARKTNFKLLRTSFFKQKIQNKTYLYSFLHNSHRLSQFKSY